MRPQSKTAVKACHSSSKTFTAAQATLWFLARFKESIVVTTAPTSNQVEKLLWGEIHASLAKSRYPFPDAQLTQLKMGPKRYALGFTTSVTKQDEGVKFQGFHADHILVILDEAPGIDPKIWEAIEGARAGGDVRVLALGNPTIASGSFHEAFHGGRESWNCFTISAFDTPNFEGISLTYKNGAGETIKLGAGDRDLLSLTEEELDTNILPYLTTRRWVRERWFEWGDGHPLWDARVLGNFPSQADDSLLSLAWLEKARNSGRKGRGTIKVGIDVAGPGEDETVFCARRECEILDIRSWSSSDPRGAIVAALEPLRPHLETVSVDSAGIGWYLYQHLLDLGFPAVPVNVGESPRDTEKFANLKAELYWSLRMRARSGDLSGTLDERTIGQLAGIRYKHNPRGQVVIESKEDARKRGVKSPDRAEAVMLAYAETGDGWGEFVKSEVQDMATAGLVKNAPQAEVKGNAPDHDICECGCTFWIMIAGVEKCMKCALPRPL